MSIQLFINSRVLQKDRLIQSINNTVIYTVVSQNDELKSYYSAQYTRIGFLWENNAPHIPFGTTSYSNNNYTFQYFKEELINYLVQYSKLEQPIKVDLITCSLNNSIFLDEVHKLRIIIPSITIEYSLNSTGSVIGSDWIMESNNESIKDIYFNEHINNYTYTLGGNIFLFNAMVSTDNNLYVCGFNDFSSDGNLGLGYHSPFEPTFKKITKWIDPVLVNLWDTTQQCYSDKKECTSLNKVTAVSCGQEMMGAIRNDNLYMIGLNGGGSESFLGLLNYAVYVPLFTKVTTGLPPYKKVIGVACGGTWTFALIEDGTLYSCGGNHSGVLGLGLPNSAVVSTFTKVPIDPNLKVLAVSTSFSNSVAIICNNGCSNSLYVCGDNTSSGIGLDPLILEVSIFTKVTQGLPQDLNVISVSCGSTCIGVILEDGALYTCGAGGTVNNLGTGTITAQPFFVRSGDGLPNNKKVIGVASNYWCTDVILEDGTLYTCGFNNFGGLGLGTLLYAGPELSFKKVTSGINNYKVTQISNAYQGFTNEIMLNNDNVYSCGFNIFGNLGQANQNTNPPESFNSIFTQVSYLTNKHEHTHGLTIFDWTYTFLVNYDTVTWNEELFINHKKKINIITNYQSLKFFIKNLKTGSKEIVHSAEFNFDLSKKLFKKDHKYKITVLNRFNDIIVKQFIIAC